MCIRDSVYIGPHIGPECFETGADVHARFVSQFGEECAFDGSHIDLAEGLRIQLERAGVSLSLIHIYTVTEALSLTDEEKKRYFAMGYQDHMGETLAAADLVVSRACLLYTSRCV